jgi:hypothetical protein
MRFSFDFALFFACFSGFIGARFLSSFLTTLAGGAIRRDNARNGADCSNSASTSVSISARSGNRASHVAALSWSSANDNAITSDASARSLVFPDALPPSTIFS